MTPRPDHRLVVAAIASAAVACSSGPKEIKPVTDCASGPTWTCGMSGRCNVTELGDGLCTVGRADHIASESLGFETAALRARTEMARVIQDRVRGFTRAVQDSMTQSGAPESSIQKIGSFQQSLTDRTLNGVTIARTHYNTDSKTYYALAAVDLKTFASTLKSLKDAGALGEATKAEIDRRAAEVVEQAQVERPGP